MLPIYRGNHWETIVDWRIQSHLSKRDTTLLQKLALNSRALNTLTAALVELPCVTLTSLGRMIEPSLSHREIEVWCKANKI